MYKKFYNNTHNHTNLLISILSSITLPNKPTPRLKRKWPRDLLKYLLKKKKKKLYTIIHTTSRITYNNNIPFLK